MDKEYLDILKQTNLRPGKVRVKERKQIFLNEQNDLDVNDNFEDDDLDSDIIDWFKDNSYPSPDQIGDIANQMGVDKSELENRIYSILSSILSEGKSSRYGGTYDPDQLDKGTDVEMEHTSHPLVANKIARDHLAEIPDYYDRLEDMENKADKLSEIFVQSSEIEAEPAGPNRDIQIVRLAVIAEMDASNLYDKLADLAESEQVSKVLTDISTEEKVHAGEFSALLRLIDPEFLDTQEEGEKEVEDLTGEDIPDED